MGKIVAPVILSQHFQPPSAGGSAAEHRAEREERLPAATIATGQQIGFFGHTQAGERRIVVVLAGEGAPTPTGGWVKVAQVPRFQRLSFTIPEGYDPYKLTVPIQFEAVKQVKGRKDLEADILNLEWMAGRAARATPMGEPPYVEVYSVNSEGKQIPLVPLRFQGEPGQSRQWWMTGLEFDPSPIKDVGGDRLRQKASVTLEEIVSTPSAVARNRAAREEAKGAYFTVYSTEAENTIRRIAAIYGVPSSAQAILEANPSIGSSEKELRVGTAVRIPKTVFRQVPA
jgi:hypothetical protein